MLQLLFFMACDLALNGPFDKPPESNSIIVAGLTSILFYTVIGYFISRIRDICTNIPHQTESRSRGNSLWCLFKILVEWAKAAIVTICLKEQGLHYKPHAFYSLLTFVYYVCSEKIFLDILPRLVGCLYFEVLDTLEHLYVPIVMTSYTVLISLILNCYLLFTVHLPFALAISYFTVYLRSKDLIVNYVKVLNLEKRTYASFKVATDKDIEDWDDICAVCLNGMHRAKITPCNHLFHPHCLKQCLQVSFQCPLCKRGFLNES